MTCLRCGHEILPGQLYIRPAFTDSTRIPGPTNRHVACPTEREVGIARLWGRWR